MGRFVTIEISEAAARRAQEAAIRSDRRAEEVLAEWIDHAAVDPPVDALADDQILTLCASELPKSQQDELVELLDRNREGTLGSGDCYRPDEIMGDYRRALVRKARAVQVAVARQLICSVS